MYVYAEVLDNKSAVKNVAVIAAENCAHPNSPTMSLGLSRPKNPADKSQQKL